MDIVTLTHKHTNSYIIKATGGCVMYDAGWCNSFRIFMETMKENNIQLKDIKYLIVSHFHIDHAGLTQLLKDYGIRLLMLENQVNGINEINEFFDKKPDKEYVYIKEEGNEVISSAESRELLKELGINGEIITTEGHSPDSVSLVIDSQCAFIGDLPPFEMAKAYNDEVMLDNWEKILSYKTPIVYHAHSNAFHVEY